LFKSVANCSQVNLDTTNIMVFSNSKASDAHVSFVTWCARSTHRWPLANDLACLTSTTTSVGHRPLNWRCPGAIHVQQQFCTRVARRSHSGRCFRKLLPTASLLHRRLRWSPSGCNWRVPCRTTDRLRRRLWRSLSAARRYRTTTP